MNPCRLSLALVALAFFAHAQGYKEAQISISGSFKKPLEIEAINKGEEIDFFCVNKSLYPYHLEIIFSGIENLNGPRSQKNVVYPGRQRLLSLRIQNPNSPHTYEYSFNYAIGNPKNVADLTFPYLIPCVPGKSVKVNNNFGDQILLSDGDTIVSMRKGIVTATPQTHNEADRLFTNALEILHDDGTVGVYKILTNSSSLVKEGQKVFPGEPIARITGSGLVQTGVYILLGQGRAKNFMHKYAISETAVISVSDFKSAIVEHPKSIIEKELTKKELKKLKEGSLYNSKN